MASNQQVTVQVPVYGGDFLARCADGSAVFIPFVLPGEQVHIRFTGIKRQFKRGIPLAIASPSPDRITPHCRHFGICGGCHYQHMTYAAQLDLKQQVLREQLARLGRIIDPPISPIVPSTRQWAYRNTIQFHISSTGKLGFQAARSHSLVEIEECLLPEPAISAFWPTLSLPSGDPAERIEIKVGNADPSAIQLTSERTAGTAQIAGVEKINFLVKGQRFTVERGAFFQVNTFQAEAMVQRLVDDLHKLEISVAYDVFCGVGLFTRFLAPLAGKVVGMEVSPQACRSFQENLADHKNVELHQGSAEAILPVLPYHPDLILFDPPRAGLSKNVRQTAARIAPRLIVYVSCDPATLARDLSFFLNNQYRLKQITPYDLFPQTYHIESLSILERI